MFPFFSEAIQAVYLILKAEHFQEKPPSRGAHGYRTAYRAVFWWDEPAQLSWARLSAESFKPELPEPAYPAKGGWLCESAAC